MTMPAAVPPVAQNDGIRIIPVDGIPEIRQGDHISDMIVDAIASSLATLAPGDVVAVTHKVISKAEGGLIDLKTIEPSPLALRYAAEWSKDARQVEVVLRQSRRILRMVRGLIVSETRHGFICANAGVDASNVSADTVCILPEDPDGAADDIRKALMRRFFPDRNEDDSAIGVIVTDSFGRPWRSGIVNVAIGVSGIAPLTDYRGQFDPSGYELKASILAVADELASAAELVMHKLAARPVAVIRGYQWQTDAMSGSGKDLIMPEERNLFI